MSAKLKDAVFYGVYSVLISAFATIMTYALLIFMNISTASWFGVFLFATCAVTAFTTIMLCYAESEMPSIDW